MANRSHSLGPVKRFWQKVTKGDPDECWPWTGARTAKGYGRFQWSPGKHLRAHRISWCLEHNVAPTTLPAEIEIHHECGNNWCCNPGCLTAIDKKTHDNLHAREVIRMIRRQIRN